MIARVVCGEHIYVDECNESEIANTLAGLGGFLTLGALFMVILPLCYVNGFSNELIIAVALFGISVSFYSIYCGMKSPQRFYDVWISGEHRYVTKTGTASDKTNIIKAVDELEGIVVERNKFYNSLKQRV